MIIQAINNSWDKRINRLETEKERNLLIIGSGQLRAREMVNIKTRERYYRPVVGAFIIHGIKDTDDFKFTDVDEAIAKGNEIYDFLVEELKTL